MIPRTKTCFVEVFEHLSEESRYKRFLRPIKHLTSKDLSYLTKVDHRDSEALVAVTPFGDPVGVARYIRTEERSSRAEVAVVILAPPAVASRGRHGESRGMWSTIASRERV